MAIPVNFKMDEDDVIFRTSGDSAVAEGIHQSRCPSTSTSSTTRSARAGASCSPASASLITGAAEISRVQALDIKPWACGDRELYVRLSPSRITGRRIRVSG